MSSAPDAEQQESSAPLDVTPGDASPPQTSGGGDLTPPPGASEQAEAEIVGPSTSTVFVAGGSGFVGSEICRQVRVGDRSRGLGDGQSLRAENGGSSRRVDY